ncbi:hypothetical protein [Salinarimonas rosea]|uniref:hypothetical protein n=1 Tax=Salinarimonas rosea TaxID=552063 RepID=UPI0003FCB8B4|nr:hypothetical protein [Salinarimonas rosea]
MLTDADVLDALRAHFILEEPGTWSPERREHELTWTPDGHDDLWTLDAIRHAPADRYVVDFGYQGVSINIDSAEELQDLLDRYVIGSHAVLCGMYQGMRSVLVAVAVEDLPARVARGVGGAVPENTPAGAWLRLVETGRVQANGS